jgi:hypothetical protein
MQKNAAPRSILMDDRYAELDRAADGCGDQSEIVAAILWESSLRAQRSLAPEGTALSTHTPCL